MSKQRIRLITESGITIALSLVLSLIKLYRAPLGGSVTLLSMLPLIVLSFRRGLPAALRASFIYSALHMILGSGVFVYVATPEGVAATIILDYIVPFTLLGLAAAFYKEEKTGRETAFFEEKKTGLSLMASVVGGTFFVLLLRFLCHLVVGAIVWYDITKDLGWNDYVFKAAGPWSYSFVYNLQFMGPEIALTMLFSPAIIKLKDIYKK